MVKFSRRHLFALILLGIGVAMVVEGFRAQGRPRTNLEDTISWCVWGLGMSSVAAGITLLFKRCARPIVVIPVALACPFVAFPAMVVLYWSAIILGVGRWPDQAIMVKSGYQMIPEARQIDDSFGPAWHSVANYKEPNSVDWISQGLFGGRYELTMYVPAEVDRHSGAITRTTGSPHIILQEVTSVQGRSVSFGRQYELSADDWRRVVAAKGDFSVIGIPLDLENPVPGFSDYQKWPRNGVQMKPVPNPRLED